MSATPSTPPLATPSQRPTLGAAVQLLAGVCDGAHQQDGVGFNGADTSFGHTMAGIPQDRWTDRQYQAVYNMVRKYRGQLAGFGIDFDAIPPTRREAAAADFPLNAKELQVDRFLDGFTEERGEHSLPADVVDQITPQGPSARDVLGPGGDIAQKLPGYEHRPEQLRMAEAVERAIAARRHLVVEAGTGTGKSLGYLVPAILASKRAVVSTADKSLQAQIVGKDIPFLQSVMPRPFTAVLLKGRGNYLCLYHLQQTRDRIAGDLFGSEIFKSDEARERWPAVQDWADHTADGDLETLPFPVPDELREHLTADSDSCIGEHCPFYEQCHSERAKSAAKTADVVIVNHALLLRDLEIRFQTEGHASVIPEAQVIVLDEAHHLEDIATDAFGADLTWGQWERAARRLLALTVEHKGARKEATDDWAARTDPIGRALRALFGTIQERLLASGVTAQRLGDETQLATPAVIGLDALVADMGEGVPDWLSAPERASWDKLRDRLKKYAGWLRAIADPENRYDLVRYAELSGQGQRAHVVLHAKPIEVAEELRERLWTLWAEEERVPVIATSATIATDGGMRFWRQRVGCPSAEELIVGSPFDFARNSLLYLPNDADRFDPTQARTPAGRSRYPADLADRITTLVDAAGGRAFLLFTSVSMLRQVYGLIGDALRQRYLVLVQGEQNRPELVRQFKANGRAVLFGVKSFWEGVDVQGEALSLVVIDKLPFPPPDDPVWAAKCEAINARRGNDWAWFNELAIPNAVIQLKQGFGRLIRTRSDRGVVALLDGRLATKPYGKRIIQALPPAARTRRLDDVRAFYAGQA